MLLILVVVSWYKYLSIVHSSKSIKNYQNTMKTSAIVLLLLGAAFNNVSAVTLKNQLQTNSELPSVKSRVDWSSAIKDLKAKVGDIEKLVRADPGIITIMPVDPIPFIEEKAADIVATESAAVSSPVLVEPEPTPTEPSPQPEPAPEPVPEPAAEPVSEPASTPASEPASEPVPDQAAPVIDLSGVAASVVDPVVEPALDLLADELSTDE